MKPRSGDTMSCLETSSQNLLPTYEAIADDLVVDSTSLLKSDEI